MDGNGRWAKKQAVRDAVSFSVKHKIESLTLYAFSSENWNRPEQEVSSLMELFVFALDNEVKSLHKHNVRLTIIGDISRFSRRLQDRIKNSVALTANNTGLNLNIAANYGGRWDITQSVQQLASSLAKGELAVEDINENAISSHLCLHDQSPVDLVIRTGGEHRISNFLIWQIAYAELYFTQVLWPDFDEQVFQNALDAFAKRERRFGGTTSETDTVNLGG